MNIKSYNLHDTLQIKKSKFNNNKLFEKQHSYELKQGINTNTNTHTHRPAQAISFSGSAVSGLQKFSHNLINFVYDNEAAYKAIYALIVAGMIKPFFVLNMPGSEEKDKQIVATKNSLQAFIGFGIEMTVAGSLAKNAIDVVTNNLKLIKENADGNSFVVPKEHTKVLENMAIESLKKDKSGFMTKLNYIKDNDPDTNILKAMWQAFRKKAVFKTDYDPNKEIFIKISEKDIDKRCDELIKTAEEHLKIYNKPGAFEFVKKLKTVVEGTLEQQRRNLLELIESGTGEDEIKTQYRNLVDGILENTPVDLYKKHKSEIKAKAQELESSLNKENAKEALDTLFDFIKDKKIPESMMDTYSTVWKNSTGLITVIGKAKIASVLLPIVMAALFAKRNAEKQKEEQSKNDGVLEHSSAFNKEKQNFETVLKNNKKPASVSTSPSFTGSTDKFINGLAKGVENISFSPFGQKMVEKMHKLPIPLNKTAARMGDLESFVITAYWLQNTARSKKIDPEQKLGLNMHTLLVTIVSSLSAFVIDTLMDKLLNKRKDQYVENLTEAAKNATKSENIEKTLQEGCKNVLDGDEAATAIKEVLTNTTDAAKTFFDEKGKLIKNTELDKTIESFAEQFCKKTTKFKSHTVFTTVVRFLVPVLMVPISGKAKQYFKKVKKEKEEAKKVSAK